MLSVELVSALLQITADLNGSKCCGSYSVEMAFKEVQRLDAVR